MNLKYLSIKSLIGLALQSSPDSDRYWDAVDALQNKASPDLVGVLNRLFAGRNARKRLLAINVFSQLRYFPCRFSKWSKPYAAEAAQAVIGEALRLGDDRLLVSAIAGAGHRPCMEFLPNLLTHVTSTDLRVRWDLAVTLGSYDDERSYMALMHLMQDDDELVRDWATFSLGTQLAVDSETVRMALLQRMDDTDAIVRGEALNGLVKRQDRRVIPFLLQELSSHDCSVEVLEAAMMLAAPELLPKLLELKKAADNDPTIEAYRLCAVHSAVAACISASH